MKSRTCRPASRRGSQARACRHRTTISLALLQGRSYGFIMGGNGDLLAAHVVYIIVIAAWVLGIMTPYFYLLKRFGVFRVSPGR